MPDEPTPVESPLAPGTQPVQVSATGPMRALTAGNADLVRAALVVVVVLLGLQLLWSARILALTAFLGVLFGLSASPAVDALERRGLRRGFGAPAVVFGVLAIILGLAAWSAPTLVTQSQELRTRFPEALLKAEGWLEVNQPRLLDMLAGSPAAGEPAALPDAPDDFTPPPAVGGKAQGRLVGAILSQAGRLKSVALGILTSTLAVIGGGVLVIFLAVYVAAEPDVYQRGLLLLFKPHTRRRLAPVLAAIAHKLRRWIGTQALAMLIIGTVTTILLLLIGVRAALPLGIIAGILEFIPNIGPTLSAIPAVAMAFVDSPQKALIVVVVYWGIQFLENNLLIPYLMKEQLDLPPALTMMTQVVMAYIFGLMGLFVATPLLAAIVVAVRMLWVVEEPAAAPDAAMGTGRGTGTYS